jgi:nitrate/nitrite-specific signal transduction histidine kinase
MSDPSNKSEFVRKIFDEGVRYMDQLLEENERLRKALAKERDAHRVTPEDVARLRSQLTLALEDAASARRQLDELRADMTRVESENSEFAAACVSLQEKQAALSSLYAASYELHASLDLKEVLQSILEIVLNLLGSESFALYLADEKHEQLRVALQEGLPPLAPQILGFGQGFVGRALAAPDAWIEHEGTPIDGEPVVVVSFRVRETAVGALAIFAFLPQKKSVTDLDRELFRLVSAQAATALHGALLHAREARRAQTLEGLIELIRPSRTRG